MSTLNISIKTNLSQTELNRDLQLESADHQLEALNLIKLLESMVKGVEQGRLEVSTSATSPVKAANTLTLASVIATDSVTIGGTELTFTSTPSTEDDVEVDGADDTADALALATAINAHSTLSKLVTASAAAAVVTVTANQAGSIGNQVALAQTGGTISIGGSGSALEDGAGGSENSPVAYNLGLNS